MLWQRCSTSLAMSMRLMRVRPQVGQETTLMPSSATADSLENRLCRVDLLDRIVGQAHADGVAHAERQQAADAGSRLDRAHVLGARLGNAEMERIIGLFDSPAGSACMVFGTEDDLMEIQMSSKSQSFSRPTWYSALSTMASGVGPPNFSRMCFSTEPEFTPMRIGRWRAFAAFTTACTRSAPPMLPGFKRILSTPDSIAASARR